MKMKEQDIDLFRFQKLAYDLGAKHASATASRSYSLAGRFYVSKTGWGVISVPNAFVRGAFDALDVPGAQLPYNEDGVLNAHISVFRPEEISKIGGPDVLTERGHSFRYSTGQLAEVVPVGWPGVSRVWLIEVNSPELEKLRKSYGLTPLMNNNKHKFHITIGVRRASVLYNNDIKKEAEDDNKDEDGKDKAVIISMCSHSVSVMSNRKLTADKIKKLINEVVGHGEGKGDSR